MDRTATDIVNPADVILDPAHRDQEPRAGQIGITRAFAQPNSLDEDNRTLRFRCSSSNVDRYGEIVAAEAFKGSLETFRANPILVAGHVYVAPDGEPTTIGTWPQIEAIADGLAGTAQFMDDDELAEKYWRRYRKGVQRAVSIGFITNAWEMREMTINGETRKVRVFTDIELLEISCVAIPANRESLARAKSAFSGARGASADEAGGNIEQRLAALETRLNQLFDTSPGGPMSQLATDIAELVRGPGGLGAEIMRGVPGEEEEPEPHQASQGDDDETKAALRGILGKDDAGSATENSN